MTPDQIKQLVVQTMNSQMSAYSTAKVPYHIHNGVDAPIVFTPVLTYIGLIKSDGTPILVPSGWSVDHSMTGYYLITHNLNTELYSVTATPLQSTNIVVAPILELFDASFSVNWWQTDVTLTPADTSFSISLTVVNNRKAYPNYVTE